MLLTPNYMKHFRFLLSYFILIIAINIHAQQFSGIIKDNSSNKEIEMVSVSLLRQDSTILNYTFSKDNGIFNLATSGDERPFFISFSHLGYRQIQINCNEFHKGQDVKMIPTDIQLKEVKVTPKRLLQKGDTLVYGVSGFKMKQDRTIGDILKKLPGINVNNDGSVTYQGNAISNFYIEGANLMDEKYGLAVNNIQAEMVKEVEILENHQAIKALKGLRSEDGAALNLRLSDDARAQIKVNADIGFGTSPFLWDNRLLGMLFAKKKQNFSIYKNNNTGKEISAELNALTIEDISNMMKGLGKEQSLFSSYSSGTPNVDENRYLFNKTHLLSINQLWKIDKDKDLHFQLSYIEDVRNKEMSSTTQYNLSADSILQIKEAQQEEYKQRKIDAQLKYTINTQHYYLVNKFNSISYFDQSCINTLKDGRNIGQHLSLNKFFISNNLKLIWQRSKNLVQLTSLNQFSILPQEMIIKPGLYTDIFNNGNNASQITQKGSLQSLFSNTFISFGHTLVNINFDYETGFILKNQQLNSRLQFINENIYSNVPDSLRNVFSLTEISGYFNPKVSYERYKLKAVLTLNTLLSFVNKKDKVFNIDKRDHSYLLFLPSFSIRYDITPQWKVSVKTSLTNTFGDIRSMHSGYLYTNYRSVNQYNPTVIGQTKRQNYTFSIDYKNIVSGFFATISSSFVKTQRNLLSSQEFEGSSILQKNKTVVYNHVDNAYRGNISIGKSFSWMGSRLFFDCFYSDAATVRLQQKNKLFYNVRQLVLKIRGIMQLAEWINGEYNIAYDKSQLGITHPDKLSYSPTINFKHKLALNIFPAKNWQLSINNELYHANHKNIPKEFFTDTSLSYRLGNNEIILSTENIFNSTYYRYENILELSRSVTEYKLRPRQFLIKYAFNF